MSAWVVNSTGNNVVAVFNYGDDFECSLNDLNMKEPTYTQATLALLSAIRAALEGGVV